MVFKISTTCSKCGKGPHRRARNAFTAFGNRRTLCQYVEPAARGSRGAREAGADCRRERSAEPGAAAARRRAGDAGAAKVVRGDATRPPPGRDPCDLVFLDPPYRSGHAAPALAALAQAGWVAPGAVVTVELAHNEDIVPPAGFAAIDERRYGAAKIVILRHAS